MPEKHGPTKFDKTCRAYITEYFFSDNTNLTSYFSFTKILSVLTEILLTTEAKDCFLGFTEFRKVVILGRFTCIVGLFRGSFMRN